MQRKPQRGHSVTDLVPFEERDAWIPVVDKVAELSKMLAQTPFVGAFRGKPADVFGAIIYGHHLHLAPLQALQAFDLIEGKPTLKSEARRALFLREGHKLDVTHWDAKRCTVRAERSDGLASVEVTYTMDDAQLAGIAGKKNWRTSPKQMLLARATALAITAVAPDVAMGLEASEPVDNLWKTQGQPVGNSTIQLQPVENPYDNTVSNRVAEVSHRVENGPETEQELSETGPGTAPETERITPAQMRKIGAQIGEWERLDGQRMDKDERRDMIRRMAGLDTLDSAKDLTKDQASEVIETLALAIQTRMDTPPPVTDSDERHGPTETAQGQLHHQPEGDHPGSTHG
jgi:hypothetical protein